MAATLQSQVMATPTAKKRKFGYFTRACSRSSDMEADISDGELHRILMQYSIDPYDHEDDHLFRMGIFMFEYYDLFNAFQFTEETLLNFFRLVREMYNPTNYFHNFKHAWGVMHMCFHVLRSGAEQFLDHFDVLAVLIGALCHDVRHPGNSNMFEITTGSTVCKKYRKSDEICVLERYHASITARLLDDDNNIDHNVLAAMSDADRDRFLQQVDYIILGTDMGKHVTLVEEARSFAESHRPANAVNLSNASSVSNSNSPQARSKSKKVLEPASSSSSTTSASYHSDSSETPPRSKPSNGKVRASPLASTKEPPAQSTPTRVKARRPLSTARTTSLSTNFWADATERRRFTRVLVHSSDIGAQTQDQSVAKKWLERVYAEYRDQAERERTLGIMTSPFLHDLQDDKKVYSSQFSFIHDTVEPIWRALSELCPSLQFALQSLIDNKNHYRKFF